MAKDAETSKPKHLDPTSEYYLSSQANSATTGDPDRTPTGRPWCTFCHRVGHTQEKCYRRLGIALPGKGRGRGSGSPAMSQNAVGSSSGPLQASAAATQNNNPSLSQAQAAATSALPSLTPEQMQRLITFMESSPSGTDSLVGKSLPPTHTWLIDSGASHHMTGNLNFFSSIWDIPPSVGLPDGLQTNAIKAGSVSLANGITLRHVLYVPNLAVNLISVSCLATDANYFMAFSHDICVLQDRTSKSPIGLGKMHRGVFVFQPLSTATVVQPLSTATVAAVSESKSYKLWHRCMGHPSSQPLIHLPTSHADHTLFTYRKGDVFLSVLVYVDDLILAGNNSTACSSFKKYLNDCFKLKDLGPLKYFLGIEAARGPRGLFLSQRKYALDILSESGLSASKPAAFPMEQNHGLALAGGPLLSDPGPYRRLIGRLVYLTITRPDICYAVHVLSQFIQSPRSQHWDAPLRVFWYLKAAPGQGLFLPTDSLLQIYAFCDSDWASCPLTRRSVTGYFVSLGNSPISWRTKKQPTVSRSSAEAEYRSMAVTTCELTWLKSFLLSLGVHHDRPMRLLCDNQAALHIALNPVFHERTKHIEIDCHYVREQLLAGNISTAHVRTAQQVANIFTKALGRHQFHYLCGKLGIRNLLTPT
ncbi:hypothetical protein RJ639_041625 [Escallonia herrerae]|uniref:Retrovirus-related Pol polyprotein from transposon RE2 n=1 Tax=Escallonia herrerae TaxID=1293975 RepID=A0AA88WJ29_9ASTE|nr:hypothetical protein RJ639_041625 [Escallonia herrerae]